MPSVHDSSCDLQDFTELEYDIDRLLTPLDSLTSDSPRYAGNNEAAAGLGLCLECGLLPTNPGHTQCPSCYAASKPLCQKCHLKPTNPGYNLCQPCFAATKPPRTQSSQQTQSTRPVRKTRGARKGTTSSDNTYPSAPQWPPMPYLFAPFLGPQPVHVLQPALQGVPYPQYAGPISPGRCISPDSEVAFFGLPYYDPHTAAESPCAPRPPSPPLAPAPHRPSHPSCVACGRGVRRGHTQCPSCYSAHKPMCQQCQQKPTNPGFSLCQPCYNSNKQQRKRPVDQRRAATPPAPPAPPLDYYHAHPLWQAPPTPFVLAPMPQPQAPMYSLAPPGAVPRVYAPHPPRSHRAPTPPSPRRSTSPSSDGSHGVSPTNSFASSQPEPPRAPSPFLPLEDPWAAAGGGSRRGSARSGGSISPLLEPPAPEAPPRKPHGSALCTVCRARPPNPGYRQCQACYRASTSAPLPPKSEPTGAGVWGPPGWFVAP